MDFYIILIGPDYIPVSGDALVIARERALWVSELESDLIYFILSTRWRI